MRVTIHGVEMGQVETQNSRALGKSQIVLMESTKSTYAISRCPQTQEPNPYLTTHLPDLRMLFAEDFHRRGLEGDSLSLDIKRKNICTQQFLSKTLSRESQEEIVNTNRVLRQHLGDNLCSSFPVGRVDFGVFGNSNPLKFTLHPRKDSTFQICRCCEKCHFIKIQGGMPTIKRNADTHVSCSYCKVYHAATNNIVNWTM